MTTNETVKTNRNKYATNIINNMTADDGLIAELQQAVKLIKQLTENLEYYTSFDVDVPSRAESTATQMRCALNKLAYSVESHRNRVAANVEAFTALNDLLND